MLDAAYKTNGSPFYRPDPITSTASNTKASTSFASQLKSSLALSATPKKKAQSDAAASPNLKTGTVSVSKATASSPAGVPKAADPQYLLNIKMDQPASSQAVTASTTTKKVATPAVSLVTNAASIVSAPLPSDSTISLNDASITALQTALQNAGIDTSGMHMEVHNDTVSYMMGSYQDRQLVVQLPGGRIASYSADLVAMNPNVTVTEMKAEKMV